MPIATAETSPASQYQRSPDTTIIPARTKTSTSVTPRAGSVATSAISGAAASAARAAFLIPGRPAAGRPTPRRYANTSAVAKMTASLANSDGSTWKPPGSAIHAYAPFTVVPAGVSTASSNSSDKTYSTGVAARYRR